MQSGSRSRPVSTPSRTSGSTAAHRTAPSARATGATRKSIPTRKEDDRCARTAVIAHELRRLSVNRGRPALDEPLLALPSELRGASPGEVCAGDAAEHRASVEPAQAVAESVPGAPHREHRLRLAAGHQIAGEVIEPLAAENDPVVVDAARVAEPTRSSSACGCASGPREA